MPLILRPAIVAVSETDIRRAIEKHVNASREAHVWKNAQYHGLTPSGYIDAGLCVGSADLIGLTKRGRFFAIEVKTPKGRISPEQLAWIEFVNQWGGFAAVARSLDEAMGHVAKACI